MEYIDIVDENNELTGIVEERRKEIRFKKMREYSHEEFVELVRNMSENELLELSANYGGYPVLFRMALDERINHIPFIQTGAAVIIRNEAGKILLQKRTDRNIWCLLGGCQELGEDLRMTAIREVYEETGIKIELQDLILIDTLSGNSRKNSYPNGDIVYNNTSLYLYDIRNEVSLELKHDSETKELKFFDIDNIPEDIMDYDLIEAYLNYIS